MPCQIHDKCGECGEMLVLGYAQMQDDGIICRKCLDRKVEEAGPVCVPGKYTYYGNPVDELSSSSGLPRFGNSAGIRAFDLGDGYAVTWYYALYGLDSKMLNLPAINCKAYKTCTEALDVGYAELSAALEAKVAEYPHKAAEIRALTKRIREKLAPTIFS